MNSIWLKKLESTMPDYENYGVKRGGDSEEKNSEMNAVFWNKTKFSAVEKNTIWLSETPERKANTPTPTKTVITVKPDATEFAAMLFC